MKNLPQHRMHVRIIILLVIIGIISGCIRDAYHKPETNLDATWIVEKDLPTIMEDLAEEQPVVQSDGVEHRVIFCQQIQDDLMYEVLFENPYNQELTAVVALAVNGDNSGTILGFFSVILPPGLARVHFNTEEAPEAERAWVLYDYLPNIGHTINSCSAHLLGFSEGIKFHVVMPVMIGEWDSEFILPTDEG